MLTRTLALTLTLTLPLTLTLTRRMALTLTRRVALTLSRSKRTSKCSLKIPILTFGHMVIHQSEMLERGHSGCALSLTGSVANQR